MTKNEVANLAISHIGLTTTIIDMDTEKSIEAKKCRLFYPVALKEALEDCRYGSLAVFKPLNLVMANPTSEWGFAYRYPADCLFFSRIMRNGASNLKTYPYVNEQWDVEYRESYDQLHGRLIYTDEPEAHAEYYVFTENNLQMSTKFWIGLSFKLAQYIAPSLAKADATKIVDRMQAQARVTFQQAQGLNHNEQKFKEEDPRSSFEIARGPY